MGGRNEALQGHRGLEVRGERFKGQGKPQNGSGSGGAAS